MNPIFFTVLADVKPIPNATEETAKFLRKNTFLKANVPRFLNLDTEIQCVSFTLRLFYVRSYTSRYQLGRHLRESQSRSELGSEENPLIPAGNWTRLPRLLTLLHWRIEVCCYYEDTNGKIGRSAYDTVTSLCVISGFDRRQIHFRFLKARGRILRVI